MVMTAPAGFGDTLHSDAKIVFRGGVGQAEIRCKAETAARHHGHVMPLQQKAAQGPGRPGAMATRSLQARQRGEARRQSRRLAANSVWLATRRDSATTIRRCRLPEPILHLRPPHAKSP